MNTDMDQPRLHTASRFGQLSKNMFFARHVPQPRFLKFITGTAGVQVCHVRDNVPHLPTQPTADLAKSLISDPRYTMEFPPNSYNESLLRSFAERVQLKKRRERFLPPLPGWNPTGTVVEDTDHWRRELARIAEMVGLVTSEELAEIEFKKEPTKLRRTPSAVTKSTTNSPSKSAYGEYSKRTGRWNETPRTLSRSRSLNRRTPLSSGVPSHLFCVDEQEREMWMLQVLGQILQTDDITEIRSWLVSSNTSEKDAVRQLISTAISGLEESGRIQPTALLGDSAKATQVTMDTLGSLMSNKFSPGPMNPSLSSSLTAINEPVSKPAVRPQTAPQTPASVARSNKPLRAVHTNLQSIEERPESTTLIRPTVPQPTKVDLKRDIQVLTLNDDAQNNPSLKKVHPDQVPF